MDGRTTAELRRALGVEEAVADRCGLCDCYLDDSGGIVEIRLDDDSGETDGWLCASCYGQVVGDMGVTPQKVFKSGDLRRVVLPGSVAMPAADD